MPSFLAGPPVPPVQQQQSTASESMYETIDQQRVVQQGPLPKRVPTYEDPDAPEYGDMGPPPPGSRHVVKQKAAVVAQDTARVGGSFLRVPSHKTRQTGTKPGGQGGYEGELTKPAVAYHGEVVVHEGLNAYGDDDDGSNAAHADNLYGDTVDQPPLPPAPQQQLYGDASATGAAVVGGNSDNIYGDDNLYGDNDAYGGANADIGSSADNLYGDTDAPAPPRPPKTNAHAPADALYGDTALYGDVDGPPTSAPHAYGDVIMATEPGMYGDGPEGDLNAVPPPRPTGQKPMPPPISSSSATSSSSSARGRTNSSGVTYDTPKRAPKRAQEQLYGDVDDEYDVNAGQAVQFSMAGLSIGGSGGGGGNNSDNVYGEPKPKPYAQPASEEQLYGDIEQEYDKPRS